VAATEACTSAASRACACLPRPAAPLRPAPGSSWHGGSAPPASARSASRSSARPWLQPRPTSSARPCGTGNWRRRRWGSTCYSSCFNHAGEDALPNGHHRESGRLPHHFLPRLDALHLDSLPEADSMASAALPCKPSPTTRPFPYSPSTGCLKTCQSRHPLCLAVHVLFAQGIEPGRPTSTPARAGGRGVV
jgi:hypothetical protein